MPVYQRMDEQRRPAWSHVTSAGVFRVPRDGRFDNHYHDCDEYWMIFQGKALVRTEGQDFLVGPGDIVCTRAGDDHDIVEVYEDLAGFWFEDATPPGGRTGHLHRTADDAAGHSVAKRDCPGLQE